MQVFDSAMTVPSLVGVLQSQVVLFKSLLFTDEFCRIFASVSRDTRVGNLAEFREAERAFDNLLELQDWDAYWRNEDWDASIGESTSPYSPGSSS